MPSRPIKQWHVEPRNLGHTLILTCGGVRYVCPIINSLEWSIRALEDLCRPDLQ